MPQVGDTIKRDRVPASQAELDKLVRKVNARRIGARRTTTKGNAR